MNAFTVILRALRQLRRDWPDTPYLFVSERGGSMTASNVRKLVARSGLAAKIPFPVHPHMLRHACGFKLANEAHDNRPILFVVRGIRRAGAPSSMDAPEG